MKKWLLLFATLMFYSDFMYASDTQNGEHKLIDGRWYSESLVKSGKRVFQRNCMACHGFNGEGITDDWKVPLEDGTYPPPPLNGTAHAWHHPMSQLIRTINHGGKAWGGKMPGFGEKLTDEEKLAVIAYFQNWWSDKIYQGWIERGGLTK